MGPANPIIVAYFPTINPNEKIGVLLPKGTKGTLKSGKASKKPKKAEQPKSILCQSRRRLSNQFKNLL